MATYNYSHLIPRPTSRDPFYAVSPHWRSITPIPLASDPPTPPPEAASASSPPQQPGGALATIAYSARYLEAMSYLRAVMAANEFSERCLALTEDIIGMNPAHYTVWLFRMRCLRGLWGVAGEDGGGSAGKVEEVEEEGETDGGVKVRVKDGVATELDWLEAVSEKNLKNYQIWHHRQSLLTILLTYNPTTPLPPSELPLLTHILSFDHKNYHVWTYRSWLCRTFPNPLLTITIDPTPTSTKITNPELTNMDMMLDEDLLNNSAWSHRYFVLFGHVELELMTTHEWTRNELFSPAGRVELAKTLDRRVVDAEVAYTMQKIGVAPQNASAWNYLRGVAKRVALPVGEMRVFCEGFVRSKEEGGEEMAQREDVVESTRRVTLADETELEFLGDGVRSSHAIDWLSELYAEEGRKEEAKRCLRALGEKWDPIRKNYWEYRVKRIDGEL